jgi:hypothetical protein
MGDYLRRNRECAGGKLTGFSDATPKPIDEFRT